MNEKTITEWAAELTWPDGHVEYRTKNRLTGDLYQRRDAECKVGDENNDWHPEGMPKVSARLVSRTVTTTAWAPVSTEVAV